MSKKSVSFDWDMSTISALEQAAETAGSTKGALSELCVRAFLATATSAQLKAWAAKQPNTRGRLAGGLTKHEQLCVSAMERITARTKGAETRYETATVASEAGLTRRDAHMALKRLLERGRVSGADSGEDRFGRPAQSFWRLVG
ncbi:hypothetical protein MYSTI_01935 [Myxococcus stipitatus DSM 14675]|uniref:Uncharacterized protein n=1 Tax=Myxococcus stipitatus (strain DSM 14675 / JCM 12634 / Mx s8) TaxID=1278073 RepID=L7U3A3_MYXSD|nr:hypothetical protein [Myxococcus stipitatus]AGC43266.1 hypothetical protein MYSTI_01935 [Myxococcus stipitatus DSM 14675]